MCFLQAHLEQGIEVPEGTFDEIVGGHFREAHLEEDLPEFGSDFEERMEIAAGGHDAQGVEVVRLESLGSPRSVLEHFRRQVRLRFGDNWGGNAQTMQPVLLKRHL